MKNVIASALLVFALVVIRNVHAAPGEKQLAAEAKITRIAAEHIALSRVPNGRIANAELEREHGKLICLLISHKMEHAISKKSK